MSNPSAEIEGIVINLQEIFKKLIDIAPYLSEEQFHAMSSIQNSGKLADKAISLMNISTKDKQEVLEELGINHQVDLMPPQSTRGFDNLEDAISQLNRRLYVAEGSAQEQRLKQVLPGFLSEDCALRIRDSQPLRPALVSWQPNHPA